MASSPEDKWHLQPGIHQRECPLSLKNKTKQKVQQLFLLGATAIKTFYAGN